MNTEHTLFPRRTFVAGAAALGAAAFASVAVPFAPRAFADEIAEKQAEADSVLASLNAMQETLDKASDDYQTALAEQAEAQARMADAQAQIEATTASIADHQEKLSNRAVAMYREGTTTFWDVLTGSSSFEEFAAGLDFLQDMNENDARLVSQLKAERAHIEELKEEYTAQEATAAQKAAEADAAAQQAEATIAQYQATYDSLSAEIAELVEQKRAAEEAARAAAAAAVLEENRRRALAEEAERRAAPSNDNSGDDDGDDDYDDPGYDDDYDDPGDDDYEDPYDDGGYYGIGDNGDVLDRAYSCLGAPYVWGAAGPSSYDCSGLVSYAITGSYSHVFTSYSLNALPAVADPVPGDVAVRAGHTGIYIGGGQMIHAADYGIGVIIGSVQEGMKIVRP